MQNKCLIPQHQTCIKFKTAENRTITRRQCEEHLRNGVVVFSGNYEDTGESVRIIHVKFNQRFVRSKCTLKCLTSSPDQCKSTNLSDIANAIYQHTNILESLSHPNLLQYISPIIHENGNIFIIQHLDNNMKTAKSVTDTTKWTYEAVGNAISSTVEAIAYLHANNIPHGGLQSSTIFVNGENVFKVGDYFLIAYLQHLAGRTNDSCFQPSVKDDCKAIAKFLKTFNIQSEKLNELKKLCNSGISIESIKNRPLLKNILRFSRLEAEFHVIPEILGAGGCGDILKVRSYTDNKEYAIKRVKLDSESSNELKRTKKEAESLAKLKHHNIVQYHTSWVETIDKATFDSYKPTADEDYMDVDDHIINGSGHQRVTVLYIKMELCKDETLSSVINSGSLRGNVQLLNRYAKQILEGLEYMHSKKVIHCDLHTDNMLLGLNDDQIKITDFGLSTYRRSVLERFRSGDESCLHIAPELKEKNTINRHVDMYSFGLAFFKMCFFPFKSVQESDVLMKIVQDINGIVPPHYIYNLNYIQYIEVMRACLNPDARKRPQAKDILRKHVFDENMIFTE